MARKQNPINDISKLVGGWLGGVVKSTPQRVVQNAMNVAGMTPMGLAVTRAKSGYDTFRNQGYVEAVKQTGKSIGVELAAELIGGAAGRGVSRGVSKVAQTRAALGKGEDLALHFSHQPNLKVIKDIKGMRNQGANLGTGFDSTQWSPPGATYAYGPIQKGPALIEIQEAISEASNSYRAAKLKGLDREYTLYVTKAKPLKGQKGAVADPEYGKNILAGNQNQVIFGKQRVISKTPMNMKRYVEAQEAIDAARSKLSQMDRKGFDALYQQELALRAQARDEIYNAVASNPKNVAAGLVPSELQYPFAAQSGLGSFENLRTSNTLPVRPDYIGPIAGAAAGQSASKQKKKARGGGKNKR